MKRNHWVSLRGGTILRIEDIKAWLYFYGGVKREITREKGRSMA